MQYKQKDNQS